MTRGRVYKDRDTWIAEARHNGKVLWSDNSGNGTQPMMLADCHKVVTAFQIVEAKGHQPTKTWSQIVDEAADL